LFLPYVYPNNVQKISGLGLFPPALAIWSQTVPEGRPEPVRVLIGGGF
jgi:hypothetical protein